MANAVVNVSSSGDNTIISAPTAGFIRVHGYVLLAANSVTVRWRDDNPTNYTGQMACGAGGGAVAPDTRDGWFDLPVGKALVLNLSSAVAVAGHVKYSIQGA